MQCSKMESVCKDFLWGRNEHHFQFEKGDELNTHHCRDENTPDLSNFGSSLADDAPDQLVGDGHLVRLLAVRAAPLPAQHCKG